MQTNNFNLFLENVISCYEFCTDSCHMSDRYELLKAVISKKHCPYLSLFLYILDSLGHTITTHKIKRKKLHGTIWNKLRLWITFEPSIFYILNLGFHIISFLKKIHSFHVLIALLNISYCNTLNVKLIFNLHNIGDHV